MKLRTPLATSPIPGAHDVLKLLPLSDLHLTARPTATQQIVSNRNYFSQMDHVAFLGDMVGNYGTDGEYLALQEFIAEMKRPFGAINGNHEFYFQVIEENERAGKHLWNEATPEEKHFQLEKFKTFFGLENLWRREENELGVFVFLGLDGVNHHKAETLSEPQLAWLESALREAGSTPSYVFCHAPLFLDRRLDMEYYDAQRTACVELGGALFDLISARDAPLFWMSGHIHLHPNHYLFSPYQLKPNVWQIHCPDSWGYSRWAREHVVPQRHDSLFSRHLEIEKNRVAFVTHDHLLQENTAREVVEF